jgi:hypothetical protein
MSIDPEPSLSHVNPRPGILRGLGVANIVFAVLSGLCIFSMSFWYVLAWSTPPTTANFKVEVISGTPPPKVPTSMAFNPMMGMEDKNFLRFSLVENGVGLLTNGLMFALGIGLLNRSGWAARGWRLLAWVRLGLTLAFWSFYIVAVAPGFSETMARSVVTMFAQQGMPANRIPPVAELTRVYSIMNLLIAVGAIVISSIYPVISLWLLSRPGAKAAIIDRPIPEPEIS